MQGQPVLGTAEIKKHQHAVGLLLILQPPHCFDPAVEGAGGETIGAGQLGHPIKRPESHVEPIHQQPFCHGVTQAPNRPRANLFHRHGQRRRARYFLIAETDRVLKT